MKAIRLALSSLAGAALLAAEGAASPPDLALSKGDRIVALGDSITQAGGYLDMIRTVLAKHHAELGVEVINAGISGHKSPDMHARLERDVISKAPTIVTVSCGVNDVWHGFQDPPRGVDLETYTRTMGRIVDDLESKTKARVYLLTPTVIHEDLDSPENRRLEPYCRAVRKIAAEKGCHLVDTNDVFQISLRASRIAGAPGFHPTSDGVHMKPAGDFLVAAAILRAMGVPMSEVLDIASPDAPAVKPSDPRIQLWGRWDLRAADTTGAVTVNTGSTIIARFEGTGLSFHFDTSRYPEQFPTLWIQVDEGEWREVVPAPSLGASKEPLPPGQHTARVVVKGFREWERRWDDPDTSIVFTGITPAKDARLVDPPPRPGRLIEYLGDSITEGVLVLNTGPRESWKRENWPRYSDGRRTWAYQSALLAGAEPRTVGFGRLGVTIQANGGVPPAMYSVDSVYAGAPLDRTRRPDTVVINLGSNDRRASPEHFGAAYRAYLDAVRRTYPEALLLCLRPFNGSHAESIESAVRSRNASGDGNVRYVDTTGWLDAEKHTTDGVHLNLDGNRIAAEKLAPILAAGAGR